jgi:uncharacterized protein YbjT (DUF2867 family)
LVGRELLRRLEADPGWARIHVLLRRATPGLETGPKLQLHLVDFTQLPADLPAVDDVFIALGTTIKTAGSQAAFRRVDLEYVVATARAAHQAGARRLAVVSALGANANSRVFYNRVKGEMQEAIAQIGFDAVVIAQPSMLIGDRASLGQPPRPGEVWTERLLGPVLGLIPAGVRPIRVETVAAAMIETLRQAPPGVKLLSSAAMQVYAAR